MATGRPVHQHVLELDQAVEMTLHLGGPESGDGTGLARLEPERVAHDTAPDAFALDPLVEQGEEPAGLRRELIE
jgi:hypothetical protein